MGPWTPSLLGEGASRELSGGVGGAFYASDRTEGIVTPDDFSLVPPGGTVSFSKKEMVGPKALPLGEEKSAPFGAQGKARAALRQKSSAAPPRTS